jgi:hypothetical protein
LESSKWIRKQSSISPSISFVENRLRGRREKVKIPTLSHKTRQGWGTLWSCAIRHRFPHVGR